MFGRRKLGHLAVVVIGTSLSFAQQSPTPQSLLASSVAAMNATNVQSQTLSGSTELIAGSTDETGTFTGQCSVSGASQFQLQTPNLSLTETRLTTNGIPSGNWLDTEGQQHSMAGHNLFTPESWFCANIALSRFLLSTSATVQFVGMEMKNGLSASHFMIVAPVASAISQSALMTHLTRNDVYLDSQTLLPIALDFNIHPDTDATVDIPVEILYGNYAIMNGALIPTMIQRYVNSTLSLTLQIQSASSSTTAATPVTQ